MKLVKDGNFSPWFCFVLWVTGIGIAIASYKLLSGGQMFVGVVVGMAGGNAGMAASGAKALVDGAILRGLDRGLRVDVTKAIGRIVAEISWVQNFAVPR
ncbi:hypothetical protein OKW50_005252 [Paraburkholderia youngii]|uniref:hypothetical protein n=1 Tax=Paraburkholderia youngii TaxID=2782701 RepID=UPI003D21915A